MDRRREIRRILPRRVHHAGWPCQTRNGKKPEKQGNNLAKPSPQRSQTCARCAYRFTFGPGANHSWLAYAGSGPDSSTPFAPFCSSPGWHSCRKMTGIKEIAAGSLGSHRADQHNLSRLPPALLATEGCARGQAIVCPNQDCRRVFTVVEDAPPACDTSGPKRRRPRARNAVLAWAPARAGLSATWCRSSPRRSR